MIWINLPNHPHIMLPQCALIIVMLPEFSHRIGMLSEHFVIIGMLPQCPLIIVMLPEFSYRIGMLPEHSVIIGMLP